MTWNFWAAILQKKQHVGGHVAYTCGMQVSDISYTCISQAKKVPTLLLISFSHLLAMPITKLCQLIMSVAVNNFSVKTSSLNQSFVTCIVSLHFLLAALTASRGQLPLKTWYCSNHLVLCTHFNFMPYRGVSLLALNKN